MSLKWDTYRYMHGTLTATCILHISTYHGFPRPKHICPSNADIQQSHSICGGVFSVLVVSFTGRETAFCGDISYVLRYQQHLIPKERDNYSHVIVENTFLTFLGFLMPGPLHNIHRHFASCRNNFVAISHPQETTPFGQLSRHTKLCVFYTRSLSLLPRPQPEHSLRGSQSSMEA